MDLLLAAAPPLGALLVLFDPVIPVPVELTTFVMIGIVVVLVLRPPVRADDSVA